MDCTVQSTPLMRQYAEIKQQYPDTLLLFRVGDFYETFSQDAICVSQLLNIILTKRANGSASTVPLAGFPYHALDNYLPRLVKAGHRVAICEQLEDPKKAKGLVKRGVKELVTPGLTLHDHVLDQKHNHYLASIFFDKKTAGIAFLDISTGEFLTAQGNITAVQQWMQNFQPAEIIFSKTQKHIFPTHFPEKYNTYHLEDWVYQKSYAYETLTQHFGTTSLQGFGIDHMPLSILTAGAILHYLSITKHNYLPHIVAISRIEKEKYMWLDPFSVKNLELISPQQEEGTSLLTVLDQTQTPMGARLMKKWILFPLKDLDSIQKRQLAVDALLQDDSLRTSIITHIKKVGDLERLIAKIAVGRAHPRDIVLLKKTLEHVHPIQTLLQKNKNTLLAQINQNLSPCIDLIKKINHILQENPPISIHQGKLINDQVHPPLDQLRSMVYQNKDYLKSLQTKATQSTGISSLKMGYNKIYGYYFEVTHIHQSKVPSDWIRKQTLVNAERYITPALKTYEEKILQAEEQMYALEQEIYQDLIKDIPAYIPAIQKNAQVLATMDCYLSFAQTAQKRQYTRPTLNLSTGLHIQQGRHPVIECNLPLDEPYIANDIFLDNEKQQIMVITGPNMAGKSALLRQTALIVLMAQIGSFVPARQATIGMVEKIFTRVGASDNLAKGASTFMVEMTETASILHNLNARSLILMDEIGRGTSTYDGIAIAWAIIEYLHHHPQRAKVLFATHYHELNLLEEQLLRVHNYSVAVKKVQNKVLFLRKLLPKGSAHSFGIEVAKMSGIPQTIVRRAHVMMEGFSREKRAEIAQGVAQGQLCLLADDQRDLKTKDTEEISVQKLVLEKLQALEIDHLSPMEALLQLQALKEMIKVSKKPTKKSI